MIHEQAQPLAPSYPYDLILTLGERKAIDWIGNRYVHGNELYHILQACHQQVISDDVDVDDSEFMPTDFGSWDGNCTIRFCFQEHQAWQVKDLLQDTQLECFDDDFAAKLHKFIDDII